MHVTTLTMNPCIDLELVVDELRSDDVVRVHSARRDPGGKGINVSNLLQRLGLVTQAIALLGGATGRDVAWLARDAGLVLTVFPISGETRTNLTINERRHNRTTRLNMRGPALAAEEYRQLRQAMAPWLRGTDMLVLSGSLPPGAPDDAYACFIADAHARHVRCVLDADGEALRAGIAARPFVAKPNVHELRRLLGEELETEEQLIAGAERVLARGAEQVIVSRGAAGAILVDATRVAVATPPAVVAQSTVGCGDALLAGFLAELGQGASPAQALRSGVAMATQSAALPGTAMCSPEQVPAMREQVSLREWTRA